MVEHADELIPHGHPSQRYCSSHTNVSRRGRRQAGPSSKCPGGSRPQLLGVSGRSRWCCWLTPTSSNEGCCERPETTVGPLRKAHEASIDGTRYHDPPDASA